MPMAGDFRLAYEQREVGQSQESVTRQPGQRARDVFESSCKQTQFSSHTHHNHTYLQSARMWQIDRYAERLNFNRRKREKKHSRCCTRVVKKKKSHSAFLSYFKSVSYFPRVSRSIHSARVSITCNCLSKLSYFTVIGSGTRWYASRKCNFLWQNTLSFLFFVYIRRLE